MAGVTFLLFPTFALVQALSAAPVPPPTARLTDAQAEALARSAMASTDPAQQAAALRRLQDHHFKGTLAKERELVLFVEGQLEDRLGESARAVVTLRRLEQAWPQSAYLPEAQVVLAGADLDHQRWQEAQSRLRKAMDADIPVESMRRAQELWLWCLAEQGRAGEAGPILKELKPLGLAKPSERGLVGLLEAQCAIQDRDGAELAYRDYRRFYPQGPRILRVELDWARLLGTTGASREAAESFQRLIRNSPTTPEADEARLALATLLADGKLPATQAKSLPSAQNLLSGMNASRLKGGGPRQATLLKARVAVQGRRWQEALDLGVQLRNQQPTPPELLVLDTVRSQALRGWAQAAVGRRQPGPLLPYLDGPGIRDLTPALRLGLVQQLAQGGLPEAAQAILRAAPAGERPALVKVVLDSGATRGDPRAALDLLPGKGGGPRENLARAQAQAALGDWPAVRAALGRAQPGPERIQTLLAYLNRPPEAGAARGARLKEAQAWLARTREPAAVREPLVIRVADLKAQAGDWKGALALYPAAPQPDSRGWVALMRATCQARLGQTAPAKATLQAAAKETAFRNERTALGRQLGL